MQSLPNLQRATIAVEKLRNYALNARHPTGQHKAKVFKAMLGIDERHAEVLAEIILSSLSRSPAFQAERDTYGMRWTTYHPVIGLNGQAVVITVGWILKDELEDAPELITCYIECEEQDRLLKLMGLS